MGEPKSRFRMYTAWALYDWANSAFALVIMAAVFPVFYQSLVVEDYVAENLPAAEAGAEPGAEAVSEAEREEVVQRGRQRGFAFWNYTQSLTMILVALLGPVLGALSDRSSSRKRYIGIFMGLGALATMLMAALPQSGWILASLLFIFARTGFGCSLIFYDALLPHFARPEDIDRVSTYGYALGYLGGAVLLAVNLPVLIDPAVLGFSDASWPARLSFVSVGVWWIAWSIPLFKAVPEPAAGVSDVQGHWLTSGFVQLWHTLKKLPRYREVLKFLIAFWLYIDGVATIISSATIYGSTLKLDTGALITALLITQVVGIPCAIGFGYLARWTGAKGGILLAIGVYIVITIFAFFLDSEAEFYALAIAVGFVQGGIQALSRSLFASIVPKHLSGEFFGFFSTFSKFAAFLGPLLVASVTSISTALGAQSAGPNGIIALIPLFVVGGLLLWRVDVDAAKAQAAAEDAAIAQSETAANAPSAQP